MYDNSALHRTVAVGYQIRKIRLARGWTLADLAKRAGTSAPAVHRYESGWDRFTLRTLRKIAEALGARLDIRLSLVAPPGRSSRKVQARHLVKALEPLFWDTDLTEECLTRNRRWVLARVLTEGRFEQVALARSFYGDAAILETVAHRSVDSITRNYWHTILEP